MPWTLHTARMLVAAGLTGGLAACSAVSGNNPESGWGSQFGASGSSVVEGEASSAIAALVDNDLGLALDPDDRRAAAEAQKHAVRFGRVGVGVPWQNEKTGRNGEVVAGAKYRVNDRECREFVHTMDVRGTVLKSRGTACREENGTWKTIS